MVMSINIIIRHANLLDLRKIPASSGAPAERKISFSAVNVSIDTFPSEK